MKYGVCEEVEALRKDGQERRMTINFITYNLYFDTYDWCCLWSHLYCVMNMSPAGQMDISAFTTESVSVIDSSLDPIKANTEPTVLDHMTDNQLENYSGLEQEVAGVSKRFISTILCRIFPSWIDDLCCLSG